MRLRISVQWSVISVQLLRRWIATSKYNANTTDLSGKLIKTNGKTTFEKKAFKQRINVLMKTQSKTREATCFLKLGGARKAKKMCGWSGAFERGVSGFFT